MLFNSYSFLIFFPIVVLVYYLFPRKIRWVWLLVASYYFYMSWNAKYALLLLASTLITYVSGLLLGSVRSGKSGEAADAAAAQRQTLAKWIVGISFVLNLGILFFFKYFEFVIENINWIFAKIGVKEVTPSFDILLPVGISFYIFQALSYTMDVYRGDVEPEKNPFKYALFVAFFPQLVAGPIERSKNLLKQIRQEHRFEFKRLWDGLLLMTWGYFLKLVLADRIAIFVDRAYAADVQYDGYIMLVASILFAFQIYCDFAGYSTIAIGAAKIMGFDLMDNFNCPYFSGSVAEFWRRWHISLSSWFKDYLYIPLGGNRKGRGRKYINIMIVFLVSGLWHGANWTYVIWGGLNGAFQVIGELFSPIRKRAAAFKETLPCAARLADGILLRLVKMIVTFVLVDITWIFFRAENLAQAFSVIKRISQIGAVEPAQMLTIYELGLSQRNFVVLGVALAIVFVADLLKYHHVKVREVIERCIFPIRWAVVIVAVCSILVFGIWGRGYASANFIYFQF